MASSQQSLAARSTSLCAPSPPPPPFVVLQPPPPARSPPPSPARQTPALGYTDAAKDVSAGAVASHAGTRGGADALASGTKGKGRENEVPLLRSTIPIDRRNVVKWADWADGASLPFESGALEEEEGEGADERPDLHAEYDLSLPAGVEPSWRSASWSPSGMSSLGGCVPARPLPSLLESSLTSPADARSCILATLTSNAEVLLFEPPKNGAKGEWFEVRRVSAELSCARSVLTNECLRADGRLDGAPHPGPRHRPCVLAH